MQSKKLKYFRNISSRIRNKDVYFLQVDTSQSYIYIHYTMEFDFWTDNFAEAIDKFI